MIFASSYQHIVRDTDQHLRLGIGMFSYITKISVGQVIVSCLNLSCLPHVHTFPRDPQTKSTPKLQTNGIIYHSLSKEREETKPKPKLDLARDYSNGVSTPHNLIPISSPWCLGDRDWSPQPSLHSLSQSGPSFLQALLSLFLHINPLHTSQIGPSLVPEHQFLCAFACIISSA